MALGNGHQVIGIPEKPLCPFKNFAPKHGQAKAVALPVHNGHLENLFQLPDPRTQRGLGNKAGLCRLAEGLLFSQRAQILQLPQGWPDGHCDRPHRAAPQFE